MWIKKELYNQLLAKENDVQYYVDLATRFRRESDTLAASLSSLRSENEALQAELDTYKQKYADEVQKRLCLIEQLEGEKQNGDP